jgi:uncharacterized protein (DUF2147 family)
MRRACVFALTAMLLAAGPVPAADAPVGRWKTTDDKTGKVESEVEVYQQGGKLFGKIVSLSEPNDAGGQPKRCTKCTDEDKDKPILGLVIIKGLSASGDRYKGGTITDPADGKVYKAEVWPEEGKLKVRGYLGVFYKTQTWVRGN